MNAVILYDTMTGHSRRLARRLAERTGLLVCDRKKQPELPQCDILFLISGIYGGESKAELLEFARNLPVARVGRVVLLTSSARQVAQGSLRKTLEAAGHTVDPEEFLCKGGFLFLAIGHPNRADLDDAARFVEARLV